MSQVRQAAVTGTAPGITPITLESTGSGANRRPFLMCVGLVQSAEGLTFYKKAGNQSAKSPRNQPAKNSRNRPADA